MCLCVCVQVLGDLLHMYRIVMCSEIIYKLSSSYSWKECWPNTFS